MIIRSTRVALPSGVQPAEIVVEEGRIAGIRPHQPQTTLEPLGDFGSLVVMPGLIDPHVHVNEPGRTEWEGFQTACAAAAAGGVTTLIDMPLNSVPPTTTVRGLEAKRAAARAASVHVEFWGGLVPGNVGELEALADAGVRGFKCFLAPSGVDEFAHVGEEDLRRALPLLARRGLPLLVHAESPAWLVPPSANDDPRQYTTWLSSRPPAAEVAAIALLVSLCREFDARIHIVHLAAADALPLVRAARAEGLRISTETCPHYLSFSAEEIAAGATLFKCAPPIREHAHREALWRALQDGTIDMIATDHSPCPPSMKGDGDFLLAWGGIASLELGLAATWTGAFERGIPLDRLAGWFCAAPAGLAGLNDRGRIAEGTNADLVVWDPDAEYTVDERQLRQRHKRTPYAGLRLRGRIVETYVGGARVYRAS